MASRLLAAVLTLAVAASVGFGLNRLYVSLSAAPWDEVSPPPPPPEAVAPTVIPPAPKPPKFKFFTGSGALPGAEARRSVPLEKVKKKTPRRKPAKKRARGRKLKKGGPLIKLKRPLLQKLESGFVNDPRSSSIMSEAQMGTAVRTAAPPSGSAAAAEEEPRAASSSSGEPRPRRMRSLGRSGVVVPKSRPSAAPQEEYIEYIEEAPIE